jgi:hypothetical protein
VLKFIVGIGLHECRVGGGWTFDVIIRRKRHPVAIPVIHTPGNQGRSAHGPGKCQTLPARHRFSSPVQFITTRNGIEAGAAPEAAGAAMRNRLPSAESRIGVRRVESGAGRAETTVAVGKGFNTAARVNRDSLPINNVNGIMGVGL